MIMRLAIVGRVGEGVLAARAVGKLGVVLRLEFVVVARAARRGDPYQQANERDLHVEGLLAGGVAAVGGDSTIIGVSVIYSWFTTFFYFWRTFAKVLRLQLVWKTSQKFYATALLTPAACVAGFAVKKVTAALYSLDSLGAMLGARHTQCCREARCRQ